MRIRIGCVDGNTYESDHVPDSEMQEELDALDGRLFTGDYSDRRVESLEEAMDTLMDMCKYDKSYNTQTFSLVIGGRNRSFNTRHIIWWECEFDS